MDMVGGESMMIRLRMRSLGVFWSAELLWLAKTNILKGV